MCYVSFGRKMTSRRTTGGQHSVLIGNIIKISFKKQRVWSLKAERLKMESRFYDTRIYSTRKYF